MIDLHGDLIGINTAILTGGGGGNQGIGFAIPINMARSVMDQIVSHGKVVRGYLGLLPQDVTPDLAKQFNVNQPRRRACWSGRNGYASLQGRPEARRHDPESEWSTCQFSS